MLQTPKNYTLFRKMVQLSQIQDLCNYTIKEVYKEYKKDNFSLSPLYLYIYEFIYYFELFQTSKSETPLIPDTFPSFQKFHYEEKTSTPVDPETLKRSFIQTCLYISYFSDHFYLNPSLFIYEWCNPIVCSWETDHPLKPMIYSHQIMITGATSMNLIFDPRCAIPPGVVLTIKTESMTTEYSHTFTSEAFKLSSDSLSILFDTSKCSDYSDYYGISFIVIPENLNAKQKEAYLSGNSNLISNDYKEMSNWNRNIDKEIIKYLNKAMRDDPKFLADMKLKPILFSSQEILLSYPTFATVPFYLLYQRIKLLLSFNNYLSISVGIINFDNMHVNHSLSYKVNSLGECIFLSPKTRILENALRATECTTEINVSIVIDNSKHGESIELKGVDPLYTECVFIQLYKQLMEKNPSLFRQQLDSKGRVFDVKYSSESGIDHGGLFRDSLSQGVLDLFGEYLSLFVPCPNARNESNINMDKYLPNPKFRSVEHLKLYEFVGIYLY